MGPGNLHNGKSERVIWVVMEARLRENRVGGLGWVGGGGNVWVGEDGVVVVVVVDSKGKLRGRMK